MADARAARNRAARGTFTFTSPPRARYLRRMKAILASIALAGAGLALTGCETDLPPDTTRPTPAEKIGRGVTGHGSISQPDRSEDPVIRENPRVGN